MTKGNRSRTRDRFPFAMQSRSQQAQLLFRQLLKNGYSHDGIVEPAEHFRKRIVGKVD